MPLLHLPTALDVLLQTTAPGTRRSASDGSPACNLMMEHGLAERVMLIYERVIKDWKSGEEADLSLVNRTAKIAKTCLSGCHERNEERCLFPLFREEGYLTELVDTLERQHDAGREVTDKIIDLSSPGRIRDETHMNILMTLCRSYIFMYRPHMSRENTELFPRLSGIASRDAIGEIMNKMDVATRDVLGDQGFAGPLRDLAELEQSLDIHDVRDFTIGYG
jgi:hemerythrin-like domain-containing protein